MWLSPDDLGARYDLKFLIMIFLRAIDISLLYIMSCICPLGLRLQGQPRENVLCSCKWLLYEPFAFKLVGQCALGQ